MVVMVIGVMILSIHAPASFFAFEKGIFDKKNNIRLESPLVFCHGDGNSSSALLLVDSHWTTIMIPLNGHN